MEVRPLPRRLRLLVCNLKGGPGKTTTSWFLAIAFSAMGYKVVTIDADLASNTLTEWYERAVKAGDTVPFAHAEWDGVDRMGVLSKFCVRLEAEHQPDIMIIDTGGERREVFQSACLYADRLLMPVGPMMPEVTRLRATTMFASEMAQVSPIAVSALLTRVPAPRAGLAREARQLIESDQPSDANDQDPYALHVMLTEITNNRHRYSVPFGAVTADAGEYADLARELIDEMEDEQ